MKANIDLYTPHAGQIKIHNAIEKTRFVVATCGRRFGKTLACTNEIVRNAWINPRSSSLWCAPTYDQSKLAFQVITSNISGAIHSATRSPMDITFKNGSVTQFRSTEKYDNLRGRGVDLLILDEAAMVNGSAWSESLRPMLSDRNGKAVIVSTPKGRNWFFQLWSRGQDPEFPNYASFKFPTSANPLIPQEEIEEARRTLPSDVFQQEYEAEFLESAGQVFRNVTNCVRDHLHEKSTPLPQSRFIAGWDIAKTTDFSCIVIMDRNTKEVVYFDRFRRIDYTLQVKRVASLAQKFNKARVVMDSTGAGDPVLEQMQRAGVNVEGITFTNSSKQNLIENLSVMLEKEEITYPKIEVLINELMSFEYDMTRAGNIRYQAPQGMHDDCVIALSLACWGIKHSTTPRARMIRWN
jgi:hypothetical protein